MDIQQLRYFVAVADTASFSRAAQRCGVAQPSLSQHIKKLEVELGYRLYDRLPRGAALTDAGRALLPRARRIVGEVNAVETGIAADLESGRSRLQVGAIPTMAPYLLPPLLKQFTRRFPDSELIVREDLTDRLVDSLLDHELDVAILSTPIHNEVIQLDVLGTERLLLVVPSDYERPFESDRVSLSFLQHRPAVVLHEIHCLGQQIESFCSAKRLARRIVCHTTQLSTALHLVGLGLGISIVPEMCARADGSKSRRYVALGRRGPQRGIAVAYHVDRTLSRLSREFISLLRADIGGGKHRFGDDRPQ